VNFFVESEYVAIHRISMSQAKLSGRGEMLLSSESVLSSENAPMATTTKLNYLGNGPPSSRNQLKPLTLQVTVMGMNKSSPIAHKPR